MTPAGFVVRDDVLCVPSWEWNTSETALLGHSVVCTLYPACTWQMSDGAIGTRLPEAWIELPNGWIVWLGVSGMSAPTARVDVYPSAVHGSCERRFAVNPDALLALIGDVARRDPVPCDGEYEGRGSAIPSQRSI